MLRSLLRGSSLSLIYRSLKEIQGAKAPAATGAKPALPSGDVLRVVLHTVIGLVVCAIVAVLVWLAVGSQVDDLAPPPQAARVVPAPAPVPAQVPAPAAEPQAPAAASQPAAQPVPQAVQDLALAITASLPTTPPLDLPKLPKDPDKAQAEYFQSQARRNQKILEIERRLSVSWRWEDLGMFRQDLSALRLILGANSELTSKWEGIEALADKQYGAAEFMFQRTLSRNPGDLSARMNLVMALIGSGKLEEARREYVRLERMAPLDPRVRGLEVALTRAEAAQAESSRAASQAASQAARQANQAPVQTLTPAPVAEAAGEPVQVDGK